VIGLKLKLNKIRTGIKYCKQSSKGRIIRTTGNNSVIFAAHNPQSFVHSKSTLPAIVVSVQQLSPLSYHPNSTT